MAAKPKAAVKKTNNNNQQQDKFDLYQKELRELLDKYEIDIIAMATAVQVQDGSLLIKAIVRHVWRQAQ